VPTPDFEILEATMHRTVDDRAGDRIFVKIPPGDWPDVPIKGFVLFPAGELHGVEIQFDPLRSQPQIKLRKELFPGLKPDRSWRFKAAKLGAIAFQISGDVPDGDSHWLFDVQKTDDV
jgi:hypothetical protein